jgi:LemA protein
MKWRFRWTLKRALFLVALVVLVLALGSGACKLTPQYDELVALNENVAKEWSGVETQLQRRYDLIPNLIEVAKGAAAHESAVFTDIASAYGSYRGARTVSARIDASYKAEAALRVLPVFVGQSFPTLQANARFAHVMRSLEHTEDLILKQRLRYNEAVAAFNTRAKSLDGRLVSLVGHFEPAPYYNPPSESQQRISVVSQPSASGALVVQAGVEVASADAGAPGPVDAGTVTAADASPSAPASIASQYVVKGVMLTGTTREAIVVGPGSREAINVRKGTTLPGTHAQVVAVDEGGVTLEDRGPDGKSAPTQLRLNR